MDADTLIPHRVQLKRTKGWKMPPNTVKVDRTTRWGNPISKRIDGARMDARLAVFMFEKIIAQNFGFRPVNHWDIWTSVDDIRRELRGKNLACWCPLDQPCHADILLELANK